MEPSDLTRIFLEQRESLYAYVLALSGDHAASEEVFQEIGVAVLREAAKGTSPEDASAWLRGVARNRTADHFRALARRRGIECAFDSFADVVDQTLSEQPESGVADPGEVDRLRDCLRHLAPRARSIVDARYQHGRALAEIARDIAWSEGAVKVALAKARRALADCLSRGRVQEAL